MYTAPPPTSTTTEYRISVDSEDAGDTTQRRKQLPQPRSFWGPISSRANRIEEAGKLENWQKRAFKQIVMLGKLPRGWDGGGSPPPTESVRDRAISLIIDVTLNTLSPPEFGPMSGGGLQIDWWSGLARELEIHISSNLELGFLKVEAGEPIAEGIISATPGPSLERLMNWLRRG